ncbi:MAG: exopolysaccharide biosynthesis polyprenyl glycosylphosphotransferase [Candidatus Eisenbacteria bacterium]|nr:exopolysaccharide biosynthesis polyprenyl glycosylphosphotransferase [Candidatus Eisenbacteria bacterium]
MRTLLVGTGPMAVRCARALRRERPARTIVGAVDSELQPELGSHEPGIPWMGALADAGAVVRRECVDEIFVALPMRSKYDDLRFAWALGRDLGVRVSTDLGMLDDARGQAAALPGGAARIVWHLHPASRFPGRQLKRAVDLGLGSIAFLLLLPLMLAAGVAVALESRGPVLFRQARVGRGGRTFTLFKFRTMVANAEELRDSISSLNEAGGIVFKITADPRLTRVGRFLRRTSVDELPQLLNVFRGEMSLVGPRPLPTWIATEMEDHTRHRRLSVLPGMTGLWQVSGRRQDFETIARLDMEYVDRWSVGLDLNILAATIPAVLRAENAY